MRCEPCGACLEAAGTLNMRGSERCFCEAGTEAVTGAVERKVEGEFERLAGWNLKAYGRRVKIKMGLSVCRSLFLKYGPGPSCIRPTCSMGSTVEVGMMAQVLFNILPIK